MIAAVDIGNSFVKCAVFDSDGTVVMDRIYPSGLPPETEDFFSSGLKKAVICSVVPALTNAWAQLALKAADLVHVAGHDSPWGFAVAVEEPAKVGIDRLANMEGALTFAGAVIVVDAGTATKIDLLEGMGKRNFVGGAIAPGLEISFEALLAKTAQLPRIELKKHSPVIGYNTETAIRSGVVHGFAAMVDGMIIRIFEERKLPPTTTVVTTGGNSSYLNGRAQLITHQRSRLTLEGLHGLAKKL